MEQLEGQDLAIHKILNGDNVFVTGSGGVGKSWVVNQVKTPKTMLCAFSGIAALNIGGVTCHKAFDLPTSVVGIKDYSKRMRVKYFDSLGNPLVDRIIIDEISMLRTDYFDLIEHRLRKQAGNDKPFGGVQVVVVGDFYQIPPIVSRADKQQYYFEQGYRSRFCFTSPSWDFEMVKLETVYRQEERGQVNLLNAVRKNTGRCKHALDVLNTRTLTYNRDVHMLNLCTFNKDADDVNNYWFDQLNTPASSFRASKMGTWAPSELPVPEVLNLKVGCRVIICANDADGAYVNGQRGVVRSLYPEVVVDVSAQGSVSINSFTWERHEYRNGERVVVGEYKQLPLRLGWAISIHKSQGMTLEGAAINTGRGCFDHGQLYVALSRVKDLRNMSVVTPLRMSDVNVEESVKQFYGDD